MIWSGLRPDRVVARRVVVALVIVARGDLQGAVLSKCLVGEPIERQSEFVSQDPASQIGVTPGRG